MARFLLRTGSLKFQGGQAETGEKGWFGRIWLEEAIRGSSRSDEGGSAKGRLIRVGVWQKTGLGSVSACWSGGVGYGHAWSRGKWVVSVWRRVRMGPHFELAHDFHSACRLDLPSALPGPSLKTRVGPNASRPQGERVASLDTLWSKGPNRRRGPTGGLSESTGRAVRLAVSGGFG